LNSTAEYYQDESVSSHHFAVFIICCLLGLVWIFWYRVVSLGFLALFTRVCWVVSPR